MEKPGNKGGGLTTKHKPTSLVTVVNALPSHPNFHLKLPGSVPLPGVSEYGYPLMKAKIVPAKQDNPFAL